MASKNNLMTVRTLTEESISGSINKVLSANGGAKIPSRPTINLLICPSALATKWLRI